MKPSRSLVFVITLLWCTGFAGGQVASLESARPEQLVRELRSFPPVLPQGFRSDGSIDSDELRRWAIYGRLREMGQAAVPALARGLEDPDVRIRRNVALFLVVGGMGLWSPREPKFDLRRLILAMTKALNDSDPRVRGSAAQAIGTLGEAAAPAVPALIALLSAADEGSRNSACIGLRGIGPAAREALPALRRALSDPSNDVRGFAQRAIERIDVAR
jgi:HEAT repeat protein